MSINNQLSLTNYFDEESQRLTRDFELYKNKYYRMHFDLSKQAITTAIEGLKNRALIVGVGAANDIPLEDLAKRFDSIVLLDISHIETEKTLKKIPQELQGKFTMVKMDLTGLFEEFSGEVEKLVGAKVTYDFFISKVFDLIVNMKRKELNFDSKKFDFVCSSLVSSQLGVNFDIYLNGLSVKTYNKPFKLPPEKNKEFNRILVSFQTNHFKDLHNWVTPEGKIYFADHFSVVGVAKLSSSLEKRKIILGNRDCVDIKTVEKCIDDFFKIESSKAWDWGLRVNTIVGSASYRDESNQEVIIPVNVVELRVYEVSSIVLSPKQSISKNQ